MTFQNAPSASDYEDGSLQERPEINKQERMRKILAGIVLLIIFLVVVRLAQNIPVREYLAKGQLSGYAVNENGNPIPVEVFVFQTDVFVNSDPNGYFVLENVPRGEQLVIVAYDAIASEVVVNVDPNVAIDLGAVVVPTNLLDELDDFSTP